MLIFDIVPIMFYNYLLPKDARGESNANLKKIIILISVGLCVLAIILSPIMIPILFPEFTEAIPVIQILSIAIIPFTAATILNSKFLGMEKTKFVLTGSIILISVQIPSIIGLAVLYGINGAAVVILLGNTCQAIYLILGYKISQK